MDAPNPYAPPRSTVADAGGQHAPPLWNPNAATLWSLLFTPIFGAILHMKNWQALGEPARAATAKHWAIGCGVFTIASSIFAVLLPESSVLNTLFRLSGLVLLLTWYYANGKEQVEHVKQRFGDGYPRRSWAVPLSLGFAAVFALLILAFLVAFLEMLAGAPP